MYNCLETEKEKNVTESSYGSPHQKLWIEGSVWYYKPEEVERHLGGEVRYDRHIKRSDFWFGLERQGLGEGEKDRKESEGRSHL